MSRSKAKKEQETWKAVAEDMKKKGTPKRSKLLMEARVQQLKRTPLKPQQPPPPRREMKLKKKQKK